MGISDSMVDRRVGRIELGPDDGFPDVLLRLKAARTDEVILAIPESSSLFLTATEFRTLVATADGVRIKVVLEMNDHLRQQLAGMFNLEWRPLLSDEPRQTPAEHPSWPVPDARLVPSRVTVPGGDLATSKPWRDEPVDASRGIAVPPKPVARPEYALEPRGSAITGQDEPGGPGIGARSIVAIVAGVMAALILAGVLSVVLRTAEVTVLANRQPVGTQLTVGYSTDGSDVPGAEITLPADEAQFTVPFVAEFPATGVLDNQGGKATGAVELRNISGDDVTLPAGTRLELFDGTAYLTTAEVEVPGGTAEEPGEAQAAIEAEAAGAAGNREPGTLTGQVSGSEGVYFANISAPIAGGTDVLVTVVTDEDITSARESALNQLSAQASSWELPDGRLVIPSTVVAVSELSIETDRVAGEQTDAFSVSAQATYRALVFDPTNLPDDVEADIRSRIEPQIPNGYVLTDRPIEFSEPAESTPGQQLVTITASIDASQVLSGEQVDAVRQATSGKSIDEARAAVAALPGMEVVDISVTPSLLVTSLPDEGRIEVNSA